jgi:hypothetical protein
VNDGVHPNDSVLEIGSDCDITGQEFGSGWWYILRTFSVDLRREIIKDSNPMPCPDRPLGELRSDKPGATGY